jgi:hypothetical protein
MKNMKVEQGWTSFLEGGEREWCYFLRIHQMEGEWAENIMIQAISDAFRLNIRIWSQDGLILIRSKQEVRKCLNVGYITGVYYFRVEARSGEEDWEEEEEEEREEGEEAEQVRTGTNEDEMERTPHFPIDPNQVSSVFNLGVEGLTSAMENVLDLGIKFVPLQNVNPSRLFADLERLRVKMLWRVLWGMREEQGLEEEEEEEDESRGEEERDEEVQKRSIERERKFGGKVLAAPMGLPARMEEAVDR